MGGCSGFKEKRDEHEALDERLFWLIRTRRLKCFSWSDFIPEFDFVFKCFEDFVLGPKRANACQVTARAHWICLETAPLEK
jgi:hypothetical protein